MNRFFQKLSPRAFSLIFAASVAGLASCDTGTKPGDTNVEDGGVKDKNPTEHNATGGENTNSSIDTHQDTINALMDTAKVKNDPYERSEKIPAKGTRTNGK